MEVILKEDVNKLGARGDVVKVAEGYGRNYLLPRKLAIQANEDNKAVVAQMKSASVRRSAKEKTQAEELAKQFDEPLKTLGEFTIPVKLHKDVTAHLKVMIEKEAVAE